MSWEQLAAPLVLTPALGFLNFLDYKAKIGTKKEQWINTALATARRVILRHWTD